jgi:hypothetical protein
VHLLEVVIYILTNFNIYKMLNNERIKEEEVVVVVVVVVVVAAAAAAGGGGLMAHRLLSLFTSH